jgi:predicted enzyme related to lactoylglutathione lyase
VGYEQDHAPGTPSWADLTSPDLVTSARFYGGLFGWDTALRGPVELTGGYLSFQVDGSDVAGLARLTGEEPPSWTTYFAVHDADETEAAVVSNGGATLAPPVDVPEVGRVALFIDPPGAVFGVWQPGEVRGAQLVGTAGSMCWHQLASRNIEAAKRFYRAIFGWSGVTTPYETSSYTAFRLGDRDVAGMVEMDRSWPRDLPSHWMTYFGVDDCDQAADDAVELGGAVAVEPFDMPHVGRTAVLGDPHGAVFSILKAGERPAPAKPAKVTVPVGDEEELQDDEPELPRMSIEYSAQGERLEASRPTS